MALISLHDIQLTFGGHALFDHISLQVEEGDRLCLLGRNGEGKSSLLRLVEGDLSPDAGEIARAPGLRVAGLGQEVPKDLSGKACEIVFPAFYDPHADKQDLLMARRCMEQLGIDPDEEFASASGGMRRRMLLARALCVQPDILLLDEPTNHLDIGTIQWLENQLKTRVKTCIFITHDRRFARALANRIAEIDRGRLYSFKASYDQFLERRADLYAAEIKQRAVFDKKLAQEEVWIRQGVQARRTRDEGRVKALLEMRRTFQERRERQGTAKLGIQAAASSGDLVAQTTGLSFSWPDKTIVSDLDITVTRGDRIGIVGPNGAGKTTLVRLLLGQLCPQKGTVRLGTRQEILYFDQLRDQLDPSKSLAWNLAGDNDALVVNGTLKHVNAYLQDFLFSPERARNPVSILSGGERNRLLLAKLFTKPSNILVLDEPTNDLDAETMDLLEDLLLGYPGTILLVSHDRYFLDNVVSSLLIVDGSGGVKEFVGTWSDWEAWQVQDAQRAKDAARDRGKAGAASGGSGGDPRRRGSASPGGLERGEVLPPSPKKLSFKESRELAELPERIASLEAELGGMHAKMGDTAFYKQPPAQIAQAQAKTAELEQAIAQAYERWTELEERA